VNNSKLVKMKQFETFEWHYVNSIGSALPRSFDPVISCALHSPIR
jgi:hypothetical protein